jgi:manganese efflux pump family protein
MTFYYIIFIAFALAIDAFVVATACTVYLGNLTSRQKFRLSFHFGFFQFFMPLIGWFAGSNIVQYIEVYDHWIAFTMLTIIGIKMIVDTNHPEVKKITSDVTKGFSLVSLSVATSMDALAVGFSIGVIGAYIFLPAIFIGLVAGTMTLLGIKLGEFLSLKFEKVVSIFGGIILIIIGIHIVLQHLEIL